MNIIFYLSILLFYLCGPIILLHFLLLPETYNRQQQLHRNIDKLFDTFDLRVFDIILKATRTFTPLFAPSLDPCLSHISMLALGCCVCQLIKTQPPFLPRSRCSLSPRYGASQHIERNRIGIMGW